MDCSVLIPDYFQAVSYHDAVEAPLDIPESTGSCRRPAQTSSTSLSIARPTARATVPANNCRSTHISSRCITHLKLIAIRHPSILFFICIPCLRQRLKHFFSPFLSGHCPLIMLRLRSLCNSFRYFSHARNYD